MTRFAALLFLILSTSLWANTLEELQQQAQANNVHAQFQLASAYLAQENPDQQTIDDALYWLETSAQGGNRQAAFELANLSLDKNSVRPDLEKALFWLTKLALADDAQAQLQLGRVYEQLSVQPDNLDLAKVWFQLAAQNATDPSLQSDAENGYNRVLEAQFNARRAKQVAAISQLDVAFDEESITLSPQAQTIDASQDHDGVLFGLMGLCLLTSSLCIWLWRKQRGLVLQRTATEQQGHAETSKMQTRVKEQDALLKQQKRQLETLYREFKKLQGQSKVSPTRPTQSKPAAPSPVHLASAMFGFKPSQLPSEREIKVRYKQLSKIYHPDLKGSEEEMKRLNGALKLLIKEVNK
ncbi:J domain-containing protein [Vibrio scophthalmi]|uniref:J domain-containing protein n=1 Tax=Vibrio scophthalmi TaxID=45658 RepID=UPI002FF33F20